jgi:hypothetical protein
MTCYASLPPGHGTERQQGMTMRGGGRNLRLFLSIFLALVISLQLSGLVDFFPEPPDENTNIRSQAYEGRPAMPGANAPIRLASSTIGRVKNATIEFDALAIDDVFDNLFQTADRDEIRIELQAPHQAYLVLGDRLYLLSDSLELGRWYHFTVDFEQHEFVRVDLDGRRVFLSDEKSVIDRDYRFDNIIVGSGFSGARPLQGAVKDFSLTIRHSPYQLSYKLLHGLVIALLILIIIVIWPSIIRFAETQATRLAAVLAALLLMRVGAADLALMPPLFDHATAAIDRALAGAMLVFTALIVGLVVTRSVHWLGARTKSPTDALTSLGRPLRAVMENSDLIFYCGILFLLLGTADWGFSHYLQNVSRTVLADLLPGFLPSSEAPPFNVDFFALVQMEIGFVGTVAVIWLMRAANLGAKRPPPPPSWLFAGFFLLSLLAIIAIPSLLSKILVGLSLVIFAFAALVRFDLLKRALRRCSGFLPSRPSATIRKARQIVSACLPVMDETESIVDVQARAASRSGFLRARKISLILATGLLIGSAITAGFPLVRAWYPVMLPNDYYEFGDTYKIPASPKDIELNRSELVQCLHELSAGINEQSAVTGEPPTATEWKCRVPRPYLEAQSTLLMRSLASTSYWQGQSGRILYHASYIYLPARHFLAYGLDNRIPYLYGYGNTIFHALLMQATGKPTLTAYFNTLPLAEFLGLFAISILVGYATRNVPAAFSALALGLAAFYTTDFWAILLAPSFSPLRYLGLVFQLASVIFVFRGAATYLRCFAIPAAMAASLFWNREFAMLGAAGQCLALLSPSLDLSFGRRFFLLGIVIAASAVFILTTTVSPDITTSIQLGFMNVGVPFLDAWTGVTVVFLAAGVQLAFSLAAFGFRDRERDARLSILPVLGLVFLKYIFNPAFAHLAFVGVLLLPMALVFYPWTDTLRNAPGRELSTIVQAALALGAFAASLFAGEVYLQRSQEFHQLFVDKFVTNRWTTLDESMPMVTPEAPISDRVAAIRREIRPDDNLLIISPFDYLLSFYANPQGYCGHFELLTNLVTRSEFDSVAACVRRSSHLLIIYDAAVQTPCPKNSQMSCASKMLGIRNIQALMESLKPSTTNIGSSGDLIFYRR